MVRSCNLLSEIHILEKIFGVSLKKKVKQMKVPVGINDFIMRETYDADTISAILDFLLDFIKDFVGDSQEDIFTGKEGKKSLDLPPAIFFIDNVHLMDKGSWLFLEKI